VSYHSQALNSSICGYRKDSEIMKQTTKQKQQQITGDIAPCIRRPRGAEVFYAQSDKFLRKGIGAGDALFVKPCQQVSAGDLVIFKMKDGGYAMGIYEGQVGGEFHFKKGRRQFYLSASGDEIYGLVVGFDAFYDIRFIELDS
jgi:hypothetical protein